MPNRRTHQRDAIRKTFEETARPLAPQEILDLAVKRAPGMGIATVYRTVKKFLGDGLIQIVELPGVPNRYELTGLDHHHHFCCRACDKVFDIEGCPERVLELAPEGFEIESHDVVLYGVCSTCAAPA